MDEIDFKPEYLDEEGYPTEQLTVFIETFQPKNYWHIKHFIERILMKVWWHPDIGISWKRPYPDRITGKRYRTLELHTLGWSGNETIMSAIRSNFWLVNAMGYNKWEAGGHFYFRINTEFK